MRALCILYHFGTVCVGGTHGFSSGRANSHRPPRLVLSLRSTVPTRNVHFVASPSSRGAAVDSSRRLASSSSPSSALKTMSLGQKRLGVAAGVLIAATTGMVSAAKAAASQNPSAAATAATLPVPLGWKNLVLAASLVVTTGGIGLTLAGVPGLSREVLKVCFRSGLQLYLVGGIILTHLLTVGNTRPWLVWSWIAFTVVLAAQEASSRVEYTYPNLYRHLILSILTGGGAIIAATLLLRILGPVVPWYAPRTWIPVAGMIFGNALTGTALAAKTVTKELVVNRDQVELRLTQGATWKEAMGTVLRTVYVTALTPLLNFLSAAGIVHIPGLMTGQILAGQSPLQAAAYQVVIFSLMAAGTCLTVQLLTRLAVRSLVDCDSDRLLPASTLRAVVKKASKGGSSWKGDRLRNAFRVVPQLYSAAKEKVQRLANQRDYVGLENGAQVHVNGESAGKKKPVFSVNLIRAGDGKSEKSSILSVNKLRIARTNVDVTLDLRYGDRVAITGRSGIGKSQVLRTLAGLENVDRRALRLFDIPSTSMSMAEWRSHVALVPQQRPSLEGTPNQFYEQVTAYASQMAKFVDGKNVIAGHQKFPVEYGADWGLAKDCFDQPWATLSGGESQRALLAIALALQPDVLLLDESTSALDEKSALLVEATLKKLRIPVVMVSHSVAQIERFCNERLSLEKEARRSEVDGTRFSP